MKIRLWAHYQCTACHRFGTNDQPMAIHRILTRTGKIRQCRGRMKPIPARPIEVIV